MLRNKLQKQVDPSIINWLVLLVGVVVVLTGLLADFGAVSSKSLAVIFVSIGTSLIASSLVLLISSRFLIRRADYTNMLVTWGLEKIYRTRSEMNSHADRTFENLKIQLDMIGFGLHAFRVSKGKELEQKVRDGLRVRILTIHPESPFVRQRELDENGVYGQITKTIMDLKDWVYQLRKISHDPTRVSIRFYYNLPLESYYRQDGYIYTGPFLYGMPSQKTISYVYRENSDGFNYWRDYFETVWQDESLTSEDYRTLNIPDFFNTISAKAPATMNNNDETDQK